VAVRVVIAEDEAIIRLDLKETLQEQGYEVVGETGRGDEAVTLVADLKPDLAILDIKMPGMDGLSAAREITAARGAAVLILTAFSQRDLIEEARDAGALAYLVKPFQTSEIIPAIEVALGRFQEMRALEEEVSTMQEVVEDQKWIGRAKGILMDELGFKEHEAFEWIRSTAMTERVRMREISRRVIEDGLRPEKSA
jgi:response regulator NasT